MHVDMGLGDVAHLPRWRVGRRHRANGKQRELVQLLCEMVLQCNGSERFRTAVVWCNYQRRQHGWRRRNGKSGYRRLRERATHPHRSFCVRYFGILANDGQLYSAHGDRDRGGVQGEHQPVPHHPASNYQPDAGLPISMPYPDPAGRSQIRSRLQVGRLPMPVGKLFSWATTLDQPSWPEI